MAVVKGSGVSSPYGVMEIQEQVALLRCVTAKIDRLESEKNTSHEYLGGLLDWVAHFTREHFGFEQRFLRLLNEHTHYKPYVSRRVAVHLEFRRRLAQLEIDETCQDKMVPERLRLFCHELLHDVEAHEQVISRVVRKSGAGPRLRNKPRRGQLAVETAQFFEFEETGAASAGVPRSGT
jgi:hemerythrin